MASNPTPGWQTVREALAIAKNADRDGWYETYEEALAALDSLEAEMERLQGRLKASGVIDLMRRAEKAEAEVERLREALREITQTDWNPIDGISPFQFEQRIHKIAADVLMGAALRGEE